MKRFLKKDTRKNEKMNLKILGTLKLLFIFVNFFIVCVGKLLFKSTLSSIKYIFNCLLLVFIADPMIKHKNIIKNRIYDKYHDNTIQNK